MSENDFDYRSTYSLVSLIFIISLIYICVYVCVCVQYVWSGEPVIEFPGFDGQVTDVQMWDYPLSYREVFKYMTSSVYRYVFVLEVSLYLFN